MMKDSQNLNFPEQELLMGGFRNSGNINGKKEKGSRFKIPQRTHFQRELLSMNDK